MKLTLSACLLVLLFTSSSIAQTKHLTIEDASGMNSALAAASLSQLQWREGTHSFVYVANNCLVEGKSESLKRDTLVRLKDMNLILKLNKLDTLKKFPFITFQDANQFTYTLANGLYSCDLVKNTITRTNTWEKDAENIDINKVTGTIAYTKGNNLFISSAGKEKAITDEKNSGILYGASRVHRNEWGIEKGTFWSPDGKKLAFYRMDESMVATYPLVDISTPIAEVRPTRYPMAGKTSHTVTIGIYEEASGQVVYLKTGISGDNQPEGGTEYLTNVTWDPDGQSLYIACLNREQNHMVLNKYRVSDGSFVKTLFEEKNPQYVEPLHGPMFLPGNSKMFIWQSQRNGFNHLYLYNESGELIRQLTDGQWVVADIQSVNTKSNRVFFYGNRENVLGRQLYAGDLKTGQIQQITTVPGTHQCRVSDDGKLFLDTYTNTQIPRVTDLLDDNGKVIQTLLRAENPLAEYKLGEMNILTLTTNNQKNLFARMIKPVDFNAAKKYPVIIYVYGGPHSQLITDTWLGGAGLFLNYLADLGYVVFTLDNRGTSNRGLEFEQAIFRNLGVYETEDQMTGVKFLKTLDFVDTTRIGINGWSYGGFMTMTMLLKNPGVFKAAACGGPVTDWKFYEVMYGERYMDTPESNPEGYKNASLLNYAGNLKGKLLIIHDDQDETVVPQNSLSFIKKCVDTGKQVDFFIYPGHEHNVRGKDRVHLNQKMVHYFQDNL